jgi:hypothetical protein
LLNRIVDNNDFARLASTAGNKKIVGIAKDGDWSLEWGKQKIKKIKNQKSGWWIAGEARTDGFGRLWAKTPGSDLSFFWV